MSLWVAERQQKMESNVNHNKTNWKMIQELALVSRFGYVIPQASIEPPRSVVPSRTFWFVTHLPCSVPV